MPDTGPPESFTERFSDTPLAAVAIAYTVGIALSRVPLEYSPALLAAACLSLTGAAALALRRKRLIPALVAGLGAILLGGLLMASAQRDGIHPNDPRSHIARGTLPLREPVLFEGCIVKNGESRGGQTVTTVKLHRFRRKEQWHLCRGKAILRIAEPDTSSSLPPARLLRGDTVAGWASWNAPRNYENPGSADTVGMLARRGIYLTGKVKSPRLLEIAAGGCSNPWTRAANAVSSRVRASLDPVAETHGSQAAAVLASLVIGDYSGLNNRTREAFQNAGALHVLVVSGLHVAWIAAVLLGFFKIIRLPEWLRFLLVSLTILLYTCVVGFQASITRCLWMFLLYLIGRMLFRGAAPVNILFGSALILLFAQPDWLFETGFQLSFLSVLAIMLTASPAVQEFIRPLLESSMHCGRPDRLFLRPGRWHRWGRTLRTRCEILVEALTDRYCPAAAGILLAGCRSAAGSVLAGGTLLLTSVAVQLWLEPLLACKFNRMSWISPAANIILVPFSSIVLSAGTAAALAHDLPLLGHALVHLAGRLAVMLLSCAERITDVAGTWQRCPTPSPSWVLTGIAALFFWSYFNWRRKWLPCAGICLLLACISTGSAPIAGRVMAEAKRILRDPEQRWAREAQILSFTFLDVGEGDSIVIRFPDAKIWVLDAGGARRAASGEDGDHGFDVGEAVVSRFLWHHWIARVDRLILSHPDVDHAGGIPAVLNNFSTGSLAYPRAASGALVDEILKTASARRVAAQQLQAGMEELRSRVRLRTLNPPADRLFALSNENSAVLQIRFGRFSALLTGDLEKSAEAALLSGQESLNGMLLKVAHHGSRSGTSDPFLDRVQPRWAVISVGSNNPFGHPSEETMRRLRKRGIQPLLTSRAGAVTFETDGRRYLVRTHVNGLTERGDL